MVLGAQRIKSIENLLVPFFLVYPMHTPIRKMGFMNLIIQQGAVPQSQS